MAGDAILMEWDVIITATIILVMLATILVLFFVIFQTKKNHYILDKIETEKRFEREIEKSQNEIREQSLKNVAWELHDNVGQLLSIAKMQLSLLERKIPAPEAMRESIAEISDLIGDSLQEIRLLSRTLNTEVVQSMGLVKIVAVELERFNKMRFLDATFTVTGKEIPLGQKDEIIIFRILQEFFSNVIRHSRASTLAVSLNYHDDKLTIIAQDNGVGFDPDTVAQGSGLINMKSRAELLGISYNIKTQRNAGVCLTLGFTYKTNVIET